MSRKLDYITPGCCDKVKDTQVVRLGLYPDDCTSQKDIKPKWYILGVTKIVSILFDTKVEIDKCPFCQEPVPDLEINEDIKNVGDWGDDYCGTCGERLMACKCLSPEYRWKVKK